MNPAFLFGDFVLIPAYLSIILPLFIRNFKFLESNFLFVIIMGIIASAITILFGIKFKLISLIWIPHGLIHWLIVFTYLVLTITFLTDQSNLIIFIIGTVLLIIHQLLGVIFPKKLTTSP